MNPRPLSDMPGPDRFRPRFLLADIDDTMTRDGRLELTSFVALWSLAQAGFLVVPVTGRPAGWCDLIIRQWPVAAVVGENGAFAYYLEEGVRREWTHPRVAPSAGDRLEAIARRVFSGVPGTRPAKDQFSRLYDFAVDFAEEPPVLSLAEAEKVRQICEGEGAHAKISSIHVNFWLGDYDKLSGTLGFVRDVLGVEQEEFREACVFVGDSANDEPMFAYFPSSIGVRNVEAFLGHMSSPPAYITVSDHGRGFAEVAGHLLGKTLTDT